MVLTKRPGWVKLGRRPLTSLVLGTGESGPQIDAGSCPGWVPRVAACERESQNLDLYAGSAGDVSWLVGSGWKEAVVEIVYARVAGIDVGKREVAVAVRVPGQSPGQRGQQVRKFKTFYPVLQQMVRWLVEQGVTHVAMESTGVYWKPVFHALCESDSLEIVLVNARHVKNVPGRKSDVIDCAWLGQLLECGLLRGSFIPPPQIAAIRELTRYRKKLIESRTRELQRLSKVLEDGGIKIDSVASSITTLSARDMIEALIGGERDPRVLADLARGVMRKKIPDLTMACSGRFGDHDGLLARMHLEHIDHLTSMIDELDTRIERVLAPFAQQMSLLRTIPGIGENAAQVIISEIGGTCPASRPPPIWRRGPACARATTSPPVSTSPAAPARATRRSAPSSPNAPGRPARPAATRAPSSVASTAGSARKAAARPP